MRTGQVSLANRRRGFSLVELIIASVIHLMVCSGAMWVFVNAAKLQREIFNHSVVDGEARKVENWLVTDMRSAITVESSYTFNGKTYQSNGETLILRLPSVNSLGVPIKIDPTPSASTSDFIVYYHDADQQMHRLLVRDTASWRDGRNTKSEDQILSKSSSKGIVYTSSFSVAPGVLGPVVVHYEFKSTRKSYTGRADYSVANAGSVYLRNRPLDPS